MRARKHPKNYRFATLSVLWALILTCIVGCGNIGGQFGHPDVRNGELEPFPSGWPPPVASSYYNVPEKIFRDKSTVGEAMSAIASALEDSGYTEVSYYGTKDGGVALVTRLERVAIDGSALPEDKRWVAGKNSHDDLAKILRNSYFLERGRFRLFVFFLGPTDFSDDRNKTLTHDEASDLLNNGNLALTQNVAEHPLGKVHCTVALYEFESKGSEVKLIPASSIPVGSLLKQNGLLAALRSGG